MNRKRAIVNALVLGGTAAALTGGAATVDVRIAIAVGVFASTAAIVYAVLHTKGVLARGLIQAHASVKLSSINFETAVPWGPFALRPSSINKVLHEIQRRKKVDVVECGTGATTLYIARALSALGSGRLFSIEHDDVWCSYIRRLLVANRLTDVVRLIHAPLANNKRFGRSTIWYDMEVLDANLPQDLDVAVLLVDGPTHQSGPEVRFSALPFFLNRFQHGGVVFLDDIHRQDELKIMDTWCRDYGAELLEIEPESGIAIMTYSKAETKNKRQEI